MKKTYITPKISTLEFLHFESVCAGSGTLSCPSGKNAPEPRNADNLCVQCLQSNRAKEFYARVNYSSPTWAADAAEACINEGLCPAGYIL